MTKQWVFMIVLAVLSAVTPRDSAARAPQLIRAQGDTCSGVCIFSLCVTDTPPIEVTPCTHLSADFTVLLQDQLADASLRKRDQFRVRVKGKTVVLICDPPTAPCKASCTVDDCGANGPLSRCQDGQCIATPTCP